MRDDHKLRAHLLGALVPLTLILVVIAYFAWRAGVTGYSPFIYDL